MELTIIFVFSLIITIFLLSYFYIKYLELKRSPFASFLIGVGVWLPSLIFVYSLPENDSVRYWVALIFTFLTPFMAALFCSKRTVKGCLSFALLACCIDLIVVEPLGQYTLYRLRLMLPDYHFTLEYGKSMYPLAVSTAKIFGIALHQLLFTLLYLLRKNLTRQLKIFLGSTALFFFISQIVTCYLFVLLSKNNITPGLPLSLFISSCIALFACIALCELTERFYNNKQAQYQLNLRLLENERQYDYYQMALENADQIRRMRHDMNNQLQAAIALFHSETAAGKEQAQDMITQLSEQIHSTGALTYCPVPIINTILSLKSQEAKKQQIRLHIQCLPFQALAVDSIDLCCILSNLLDNALQYCDTGRKDPVINIHIGMNDAYFVIHIENPSNHVPKEDRNGHFVSSHKNTMLHGHGLKSVEAAAVKYEGSLQCVFEQGIFSASVFLLPPSKQIPVSRSVYFG